MDVTAETVLPLALVAVYLIDCLQLLSMRDAMVRTRSGRLYDLSFGSGFELNHRRPFLPNPLTPFRPDFRIEWRASEATAQNVAGAAEEMRDYLQAIKPIGWLVTVCGAAIVLVAPIALVLGYQLIFVIAAALCFVCSLAACIVVVLRKKRLGLTTSQTFTFVLVALICLPCAPNLARALTRHRRWKLPASDLIELGFDPARRTKIQREIEQALTRAKSYIPEDDAQYRAIDEQIRRLSERNA